ncbi:regulator of telomere elongation helicase [Penaeus vannamei]|uniref:Regulator of telomere elongation helicase n=1 Tax=Penaeus vannamei TaxID=6689 RepID=A0A3R7MHV3_PENVA|nr:regulator of telomere elongation helicase [Penaeus vannamei]
MLSYTSTIKISICLLGVFVVQSCGHLGSCEDHTPRCADWARRGLCRQNELFMAHNCPVSCDLCIDPQCRDQDRRCSAFAQQGQCSVIPNMLQICPHSCNNCNIPVFKTIINPDFQCGGPGNAQRNRRQVLFPDEVGQRKPTKPPVVKKEKPMMKVGKCS